MAVAAKKAFRCNDLHAIADKGYFSDHEILARHEAGISMTVPRPATSGHAAKGIFAKADFTYSAERDVYLCPAGEVLFPFLTEHLLVPELVLSTLSGQVHSDYIGAHALVSMLAKVKWLFGDRGYDADLFREVVLE